MNQLIHFPLHEEDVLFNLNYIVEKEFRRKAKLVKIDYKNKVEQKSNLWKCEGVLAGLEWAEPPNLQWLTAPTLLSQRS